MIGEMRSGLLAIGKGALECVQIKYLWRFQWRHNAKQHLPNMLGSAQWFAGLVVVTRW
jgi:hypothetical protein